MTPSLDEILINREKRATAQMQLLNKWNNSVVSFSLNIPGLEKKNEEYDEVFNEGCLLLKNRFASSILEEIYIKSSAGDSFLFVVAGDSCLIKSETIVIEENHKLGRLFDIDVIDKNGVPVSRKQLGKTERKCFICDDIAKNCARSQKHDIDIIKNKIKSIINEWREEKYSTYYSDLVEKALLAEVATTPKPGLVDKSNSGSHSDMNYDLFVKSIKALKPEFKKFVCLGFENATFENIRKEGLNAEEIMLNATNGVNTYKGIIFSLGFLCVSIGNELSKSSKISLDGVLNRCSYYGQMSLNDFKSDLYLNTHGAACNVNYGIDGIRGEVASGFNTIVNISLPCLINSINDGYNENEASIKTLIKLISCVQDTNMVHRGGIDKAIKKMNQAKMIEKTITKDNILKIADRLDKEYIEEKLSPGGCADLLAITLFFYYISLN